MLEKSKIILGRYKFREGMLNLLSFKEKSTLKLYKNFKKNRYNIY